jgi:hypothetical protein
MYHSIPNPCGFLEQGIGVNNIHYYCMAVPVLA